ncbi:MAG: hypothetical protein R3C58_01345 [Parvularculaceae bacterium]
MTKEKKTNGAAATAQQIEELSGRIEAMSVMLERMEGRLEILHQECQRTAGAAQRMLLRQESLSNDVGRLENALRGE